MTSFFHQNSSQIKAHAQNCETLAELHRLLGWKDFQSTRRANEVLGLGLPIVRKSSAPKREAQSNPKPQGKGAKPKGGADG